MGAGGPGKRRGIFPADWTPPPVLAPRRGGHAAGEPRGGGRPGSDRAVSGDPPAPASKPVRRGADDTDGSFRAGAVPLPSSKTGRVPPARRTRAALPAGAGGTAGSRFPGDVGSALLRDAWVAAGEGEPPEFEVAEGALQVEGWRQNLDREILRRLRRGMPPAERRLDLHGCSLEKAHALLHDFLGKAWADGARVLLVIHGKGAHSRQDAPVLRDQVPRWLAEPPAVHCVLCFTTARACDGGGGALYVRLSSRRTGVGRRGGTDE